MSQRFMCRPRGRRVRADVDLDPGDAARVEALVDAESALRGERVSTAEILRRLIRIGLARSVHEATKHVWPAEVTQRAAVPIHPAWLRLAGEFLGRYADRLGNDGCTDWIWPAWFPAAEKEPFLRAMERHNAHGETPEDVGRTLAVYGGDDGPPNWWVARFLAHILDPKAVE